MHDVLQTPFANSGTISVPRPSLASGAHACTSMCVQWMPVQSAWQALIKPLRVEVVAAASRCGADKTKIQLSPHVHQVHSRLCTGITLCCAVRDCRSAWQACSVWVSATCHARLATVSSRAAWPRARSAAWLPCPFQPDRM
jgi:hypothetical protein